MGQQWNHLKDTHHYQQWIQFLDELKLLQGPIETVSLPAEKTYPMDLSLQPYVNPSTQPLSSFSTSFAPSQNLMESGYNNNNLARPSEKKSSTLQIMVKVVGVDVRMKSSSGADSSCIVISSGPITCDGKMDDDCDVS